ncbi:MAG: lipopolysaccharide assembly protein B [bacterium]|nr:MAG: lipopolysaccharide assembly protein B [bacterium]
MVFRFFLPLILVFLFFLYLAYLNPGSINFAYAPDRSVSIPIVALVMLSFLAGVLSLSIVNLFKSFGWYLSGIKERLRRRKQRRIQNRISKAREKSEQGKTQKALSGVEKALSSDPANFDALILKGNLLRAMGKNKKALEAHSRALAHRPSDINATLQLKEDYRNAGNMDTAYRLLEQMRGRMPKDVTLLSEMRDIRESQKDFKHAIVLQKELLNLTSGADEQKAEILRTARLYYLNAGSLAESGNTKEATKELEKAVKVMPGFLPASITLADLAVKRGGIRDAEAVLKKEFRLSHSIIPLCKLEEIYNALGRNEKTEEMYRWAMTIVQGIRILLLFIAMAQIRKSDFSSAERTLKDAEDKFGKLAVYQLMAGIVELNTVDSDTFSGDYFKKALEAEWGSFVQYQCGDCRLRKMEYFPQCPSCKQWGSAEAKFCTS